MHPSFRLALPLLLAAALPRRPRAQPPPVPCGFVPFPATNFEGVDLPGQPAAMNLTQPDDCAALCCGARALGCIGYTLNAGAAGARWCFLKSSVAAVPYPGGDSGLINGSEHWTTDHANARNSARAGRRRARAAEGERRRPA